MAALIRVAIAGLLALASAAPAKVPAGHPTHRKILFAAQDPGTVPGLRVLGTMKEGVWLAADPSAALALLSRDTSVRILFPLEAAYLEQVKGLRTERVKARMEFVLDAEGANGENNSLSHLFSLEEEFIADLAKGTRLPGGRGKAFEDLYDSSFRILDALNPRSTLESSDIESLLRFFGEVLAGLNEEIESLEKRYPKLAPARDTARFAARDRLAFDLEKVRKQLRPSLPDPGMRGPAKGRVRVYHVTPYDSALAHPINGEEHTFARAWKGGVVTTGEDWNMFPLEAKGRKAALLYLDEGEMARDIGGLDDSQLPSRFARRLKPMTADRLAAHLAREQLYLVWKGGEVARLIAKRDAGLATKCRDHLEKEKDALRSLLAAYPGSRGVEADDTEAARNATSYQIEEMEFYLAFAKASQWPEAVGAIEKALELKRAQAAAIVKAGKKK